MLLEARGKSFIMFQNFCGLHLQKFLEILAKKDIINLSQKKEMFLFVKTLLKTLLEKRFLKNL